MCLLLIGSDHTGDVHETGEGGLKRLLCARELILHPIVLQVVSRVLEVKVLVVCLGGGGGGGEVVTMETERERVDQYMDRRKR